VTHDQEEALTMSDRIAVMNNGVIEQLDTPEAVYERPRTTFVAGFIGVSNLMPGRVVSNGSAGEIRLDSGAQVRAATQGLSAGERCYAVVRPEKLRIERGDEPSGGDRAEVAGVIESSLYLGTATQFVVRLPDGVAMTVLVPNADEAERRRLPAAGVDVRLAWQSEHTHVVREAEGAAREQGKRDDDSELATARPAEPAATHGE
jgi:spermidine/putrescine transport system ATP-binding protein